MITIYRTSVLKYNHALCNIIEPIFEKTFIKESFSNQKGKGTHKAIDLFRSFSYQNQYVLKCDIKKYFPSIDHEILKEIIRRKIKDSNILWLINLIIDNSNPQEEIIDYYPGDDLFTPSKRKKGIPIGNLTSQFFANVYLNPMDHFIKENLQCEFYIRYVDDFVIFGNSKKQLWNIQEKIQEFLNHYRLKLHERKTIISPVSKGIKYLGYSIYPNRIELKTENIQRFKKRMQKYSNEFKKGEIQLEKIKQSIASFTGYTKKSSSSNISTKILSKLFI